MVIGIDLLHIPPLAGAHFLPSHDVTDPATHAELQALLPSGQAHVILSDMAPNATGFRDMDHERLVSMCLSLIDLAEKVLLPGGSLLCKYWDGVLAHRLQEKLSSVFSSVRTVKPDASRKDSAERYFLARMYRGSVKWRFSLSSRLLVCVRLTEGLPVLLSFLNSKQLICVLSRGGTVEASVRLLLTSATLNPLQPEHSSSESLKWKPMQEIFLESPSLSFFCLLIVWPNYLFHTLSL